VEALRASHAIYSSLLPRREPREAAHTSLQGWLAPWPRQSMEPMVLAVEGVAPKALWARPSFSSAGTWNAERLLHQHWQAVETDLGADEGVLRVEGSDVPKPGRHSAGVKRQ
jgi:SRSO17 transposase